MRKIKSFVLAVIGLLCSMGMKAYDFEVNGICYNITSSKNKTVEVTNSGKVIVGGITIPEIVYYNDIDYKVTRIGEQAFVGAEFTTINLPNSLVSIGRYAFMGCDLMTSLVIPNSVKTIEREAFQYCKSLTSITLSENLTEIGHYAFEDCLGLTTITLPNNLISLGACVFIRCRNLTSITIPKNVTNIGHGIFSVCPNLKSVIVDEDNKVYDSREGCNAIIESASNTLIAGCVATNIPESVTSIGESAFRNCIGITSIIIPNSVTSIGIEAFIGCSDLISITIPNSIVDIEKSAFEYCIALNSITLGNNLTRIGAWSFSGCKNITEVKCYAEVPPTCGTMAFDGIDKKKCVLQVPQSCLAAYQQADQWKEFFFIEDVLTAIGGVTADGAVSATADVYSTNGMLIKRNAELKNLKHELPAGIYIIGGKKVWVK